MATHRSDDEETTKKKRNSHKSPEENKYLVDDPMKRHTGLKLDIESGGEERRISDLRRVALEKARKMSKD
jgi:hypothetical protein